MKLSSPASRLHAPVGKLVAPTAPQQREQFRSTAEPWRKWYSLKRWKDIRWDVLVRDLFTCQWPGCGQAHGDTSQLVAHHKVRHRGAPSLFWDEDNLICVCKTCHDGPIKAAEHTLGGG